MRSEMNYINLNFIVVIEFTFFFFAAGCKIENVGEGWN
jgi:hypothetical protein